MNRALSWAGDRAIVGVANLMDAVFIRQLLKYADCRLKNE